MSEIVFSFDIFDTTLVRVWAKPADLFWELAQQLRSENLITLPPEKWMQLRIEAEASRRERNESKEVTHDEIYEEIAINCRWSLAERKRAMQIEIELESQSIRPVPEIKQKIQALRRDRSRIIYLSDMYLPPEVIRNLLQMHGLWESDDGLYISSAWGEMKYNGLLYRRCFEKENIQAAQLQHIGDNFHSDVVVARSLGIKAEHFTKTQPNRYEKLMQEADYLPVKLRSLLAGVSRLTRLRSREESDEKKVIWDTAASVIAPVLFGFGYWCLLEAQRRQIERLYFIARDGQVLVKIAEIICRKWKINVECRYLYGSRQAYHLPAIKQIGDEELDWIFDPTQFLSVESVCERVSLQTALVERELASFAFDPSSWSRNLSGEERARLRRCFQESNINNLILENAGKHRSQAFAYLQQEGLTDGKTWGIVDIGWNGRLQRSLCRLLKLEGAYPKGGSKGFYFSLAGRSRAFAGDELIAYFTDPDKPAERDRLCYYRGVLEVFVMADHGGTLGFHNENARYAPILRERLNKSAIDWGVRVQQEAIREFSEELTDCLKPEDCQTDYFLAVTETLLEEFIERPDQLESDVFGSICIYEDQAENVSYELAPVYRLNDCFNLLTYKRNIHHSVWLPATIMRSGRLVKVLLSRDSMDAVDGIRWRIGAVKNRVTQYGLRPKMK